MKKIVLSATVLGTMLVPLFHATPAQAQSTRTWVSGVGDDFNPCSRTAPCKTFSAAMSKTAAGGVINCLDPGGFGTITINKSLEINCLYTEGGILSASVNAVTVNTAGTTVVLRGLTLDGVGFSSTPGLVGVNITAAANVHIEKCTIRGFRAGNASGVRISNTSGTARVNISDSHITDNGTAALGGGIMSVPGAAAFAFVQLNNVNVNNNFNGTANTSTSRNRISHAVFSNNTVGIQADIGAVVTLNDADVVFNNTGISGATTTFGNNRIIGNTSDGTAPTAAGAQSHDLGQK